MGHGTWDVPGTLKNLWDTSRANTAIQYNLRDKDFPRRFLRYHHLPSKNATPFEDYP